MNIIIPDSWLREFLKTKATPPEIAKYLSACGPSVERIVPAKKDLLYHIEVTSNRPDAFSVFGIAKEAAAILPRFGIRARLVNPQGLNLNLVRETSQTLNLKVKISKQSLCPRFSAIILSSVKIAPSPKIMIDRLEKVGIHPINNVVDVSNYLMYELGQPMHVFDFNEIKKSQINLRETKEGEELVTLDGTIRKLAKGTIVIEDDKRLIDLCGIMGARNSEVTYKTKNVLLFVQIYDPSKIRKTGQAIKFRTEASQRFEKGLDQEGVIPALKRAVFLLKKDSGAKISSELIDIYNKKPDKFVSLTFDTLARILGTPIPPTEVANILNSLDFKVISKNKHKLTCQVPSARYDDIEIEEDLVEEVARIYGYFNLEGTLPEGKPPGLLKNPVFKLESQIRQLLKHLGFFEIYTNSLVSKKSLTDYGFDTNHALKVINPLNLDNEYLRPSLTPSLIEVATKNQLRKSNLSLFEIANIYSPKTSGLPNEELVCCLVMLGKDFFETKGIVQSIFEELKITNLKFTHSSQKATFNTADIFFNNNRLGTIGQLPNDFLKSLPIKDKVTFAELDLEKITKFANIQKPFKLFSKYPETFEDLAIIINRNITIAEIEDSLEKAKIKNLKSEEVFDIFEDGKFGKESKSITLRLIFGSSTHTLTQKEITNSKKQAIVLLTKKFLASIRS